MKQYDIGIACFALIYRSHTSYWSGLYNLMKRMARGGRWLWLNRNIRERSPTPCFTNARCNGTTHLHSFNRTYGPARNFALTAPLFTEILIAGGRCATRRISISALNSERHQKLKGCSEISEPLCEECIIMQLRQR